MKRICVHATLIAAITIALLLPSRATLFLDAYVDIQGLDCLEIEQLSSELKALIDKRQKLTLERTLAIQSNDLAAVSRISTETNHLEIRIRAVNVLMDFLNSAPILTNVVPVPTSDKVRFLMAQSAAGNADPRWPKARIDYLTLNSSLPTARELWPKVAGGMKGEGG